MTLDELKELVSLGKIDTVLVCMIDMQGRMMGKRCQASYFVEKAYSATHACDYLLATDMEMTPVPGFESSGWNRGYGDFLLIPDISTLRVATWLEGTALVICDICESNGNLVAHSPRSILKNQLAKLEQRGLKAYFASELEFYVFNEPYDSLVERGFRGIRPWGYYNQDYSITATSKHEGLIRPLRNSLHKSGIKIECSKGEGSSGQQEINVQYADPLVMADNHSIIKNASKEIAYQQNKSISFMAKLGETLSGSSSHIHNSIWSLENSPLFYDKYEKNGMSQLMQQYLAGQLKYSNDITLLLAPYINSYKRFQSDTFAPTKIAWSYDNRTTGYRVCGENSSAIRVECRIGGADLNPYLAFAGLIAAGLAGIDEKLTLSEPYVGDAYRSTELQEISKSLRCAITASSQSSWLREALGHQVVDHYLHAARWEQSEFDKKVTDWEVARYFERC